MAAVVSVLVVVLVAWRASKGGPGRGTPSGRLIAWLVVILVGLVVIGLKSPSAASAAVSGFIRGIGAAAQGLVNFAGQFSR